MTKPSPEACYKDLEPAYVELNMLIATAPLTDQQRCGLSLLALTHQAVATAAYFQKTEGGGSLLSHFDEVVTLARAAVATASDEIVRKRLSVVK
jgi:hypothetical protein